MKQIKKLKVEELEARIAPGHVHTALNGFEINPTKNTVDARINDVESAGHQSIADRSQARLDRIAHSASDKLSAVGEGSGAFFTILNDTGGKFQRILDRLNNVLGGPL